MFSSLEEVGQRLRATGYIADSMAATTVYSARRPESSPQFHAGMAGLAKALRDWSLGKPPSVWEILDLAQTLKVLGREQNPPEMRDILPPLLAKTEADRRKPLLRDGFASLIYDAQQYSAAALRGNTA